MTTARSWLILGHRYRYATDNTSVAFPAGVVGGFLIACAPIRRVFHHGVEESRLRFRIAGPRGGRSGRRVVIYQVMLPHGLCWTWFGC